MKARSVLLFVFTFQASLAQVLHLQPEIGPALDFSAAEIAKYNACAKIQEKLNTGVRWEQLSVVEKNALEQCTKDNVWATHESGSSWYNGPGAPIKIEASSTLAPQGRFSYVPENAHDFSYGTAWVEGVKGYGIGEYLRYTFAPETPRITTIKIANGFVRSPSAWSGNSRVKKLKMYVDGELFAYLNLKDVRAEQYFKIPALGYADRADMQKLKQKPNWTIKFEIAEVYKGTLYDDVCISEIFFEGLDVLCLAAGTKISMADGSYKNIEDLTKGDKVLSYNIIEDTYEPATIIELAHPIHHRLIQIDLSDGTSITSTQDHPFFNGSSWYSFAPEKTMKAYQINQVGQLEPGMSLLAYQQKVRVRSIQEINAPMVTYTIVELDQNTAFIANGVVVGTAKLRLPFYDEIAPTFE